uniref:Peptidase S1 domain-containing protein n=1 Tax=Anopheles farauti TaxID=69004 RepID=A0A182QW29_9DIPT
MGPDTRTIVLFVACLTGAVATGVVSLQHRGQHACNAVHVVDDFFLTAATCFGQRDSLTFELISSKSHRNVHCNVTHYRAHPKYVFLKHNIAVLVGKCEPGTYPESSVSIREAKSEGLLALLGSGGTLGEINRQLKLQHCSVCQKEYGVFDCKRQLCVKPVGKDARAPCDLEELACTRHKENWRGFYRMAFQVAASSPSE